MLLAEVVVDVAIWGLNKGLTYEVPDKLAPALRVGSVVRVPLRNRKVRGWVVGLSFFDPAPPAAEMPGKLQQVAAVSGRGPVFDEALLGMARGLSRLYVHPLSSFLSLFTPARMGRPLARRPDAPFPASGHAGATEERPSTHAAGQKLVRLSPGEDPTERYSNQVEEQFEKGRGSLVAVPEVREGSRVLEELARRFPKEAAVVHSGRDPQERSRDLWAVAEGKKNLVLGGRAAMFAPPFDAGIIIVHQEHDPSFKDQRSPYYDAREAARWRASRTNASLLLASSTPSLSSIALLGPKGLWEEPLRADQRATWPIVETVDPPGRAGIPRRAVAAIIEERARGRRTLVLLPRAQATRAGPGPAEVERFLSRVVPDARIGRADRPALGASPGALSGALQADVVIATEAALAEVDRPPLGLAIALGVDVYFQRPSGRAAEDAFQTLWALGTLVAGKPKGRLVLETATPETPAIQGLVRGDYAYFSRWELQERAAAEAPPFRKLVKLSMREWPEDPVIEQLRALPGVDLLGPAPGGRLGFEILLKVRNLEPILDLLSSMVEENSGRMLVEVEPREW